MVYHRFESGRYHGVGSWMVDRIEYMKLFSKPIPFGSALTIVLRRL